MAVYNPYEQPEFDEKYVEKAVRTIAENRAQEYVDETAGGDFCKMTPEHQKQLIDAFALLVDDGDPEVQQCALEYAIDAEEDARARAEDRAYEAYREREWDD